MHKQRPTTGWPKLCLHRANQYQARYKNTIKILCWAEILAVIHCTSNRRHRFSTDMLLNTLIKLQQEPQGKQIRTQICCIIQPFQFSTTKLQDIQQNRKVWWRVNTQNVIYLYPLNRILFNHKMDLSTDTCHIQYKWTLKALSYVKQVRCKRPYWMIPFMSRIGKSIKAESRLVFSTGWGKWCRKGER